MAITAPQTSYSLTNTAAVAGMLAGLDPGTEVLGQFQAGELGILPGMMVEQDPADPTKARRPQTASPAGVFLGIVLYDASAYVASTGIPVGTQLRILRRGRVYAQFNGTAGSDMSTLINVNSSSTVATNRGILTDAATSAGAGTEIYATKLRVFEETTTSPSGLVVVELNGALQ